MSEPTQPWERRRGESSKAFAAFTTYRDLGRKRTLVEACAIYRGRKEDGKRTAVSRSVDGHFRRWYKNGDWAVRASAYDDHLDAEARAALEPLQIRTAVEVRRELLGAAREVSSALIGMARGDVPADGAQVRACEAVLARCGIVEVRNIDLTSAGETLGAAWDRARRDVDGMTNAELATYLAAARSAR